MNRIIKFRCWSVGEQKMFIPSDIMNGLCDTENGDPYEEEFFVHMQYTGLKDYNGKEIYEGDIVDISWNDGLQNKQTIAVVKFSLGCFIYDDQKRRDFTHLGHMKHIVIGNIYQNPELLNP